MVAARMMVPLRGDLATRLAPQRFWFGMEVVARCLYWVSWLWHTKDGKLMVKLSGQRSVAGNGASPARCVRSKFPPPNLQKASAGQSGLADLVAVVPFGSPKDLRPTPIATPTTGRSQVLYPRFRPVCTFLGEAARTAWLWLAMTPIACQQLHFLEVLFPRSSSF